MDLIIQEGSQETVFTWEEYEEHKAEMKRRSFDGYSKVREYWFSGVLICGKCGSKMSGRYHQNKRKDGSYNKITSYICVGRQTGRGCDMPMFRQELVEKLFLEWIEDRIAIDEGTMREIKVSKKEKANLSLRDDLNNELKRIKERRKKWQRMFADDLITQDELREHNKDEQENEKVVLSELEKLPEEETKLSEDMNEVLFGIPEVWPLMSDGDKKS